MPLPFFITFHFHNYLRPFHAATVANAYCFIAPFCLLHLTHIFMSKRFTMEHEAWNISGVLSYGASMLNALPALRCRSFTMWLEPLW